MKIFVCLVAIAMVTASPQGRVFNNVQKTGSSTNSAPQSGRVQNQWGPKAYGPGLNNPWAIPPNNFIMQRAVELANTNNNLLVRVDVDGDVELTDRFGREIDGIFDHFGRDLTELYGL